MPRRYHSSYADVTPLTPDRIPDSPPPMTPPPSNPFDAVVTPLTSDPILDSPAPMPPSPFDSSDADVTLRTSYGTIFKVYSRILVIASPVFQEMLELPREDASINVPESGKIMNILLSFIYPIEDPPIETLSLLSDVLLAALKYHMRSVSKSLRRLLVSPKFVEEEPIRVYAIACRHGLDEEAKTASSHALAINVFESPPVDELKLITGYDYCRLVTLHWTRSEAARNLLVEVARSCPSCHYGSTESMDHWVSRAKEELQLRPTSAVIFSMPFLAASSHVQCGSCSAGILNAYDCLLELKRRIDELPSTV